MVQSPRDWETLAAGLAGEVALPGSPAYEQAHKPFNARFHDVRPQAIVLCATPHDVAETIAFSSRHALENAVRSGGHCFAGQSSTRGALIDVSPMHSVSVSGGIATVGAGARLGDVYAALQPDGLAIPGGTCPPVGIAGLTLGGGLGVVGRTYGVTSDRMVGAQIVPLPTEAIGRLLDTFSQGRAVGESRELDFMPWGGAYNRVRPDATAFVHRNELFQLKHAVVVDPHASTRAKEAAHRWVRRSWTYVHPWGSGRVFQNFPDADLVEWADAYYGTNYPRLLRVKARYDPTGFFRARQSLPVG